MKVKTKQLSVNETSIEVTADPEELNAIKETVLAKLRPDVKIPGFRSDRAPLNLVEKHVNSTLLQSEFVDQAVNQLYSQAIVEAKLRPVDQPKVTVKLFVPFNQLTFEAVVPVIGAIELPDYKKMKFGKSVTAPVKPSDIDSVISNLTQRLATKTDVARPAKLGDEVWIDFKGVDSKGEPISGATGQNYPLELGSGTFIAGFEDKLIGLSAGAETDFDIKFPDDYGVKKLQSKPVKFSVTVIKVQSVKPPKVDDALASKAGPFKTLAELKDDIKKQLTAEKQLQAKRDFESKLLLDIAKKTRLSLPPSLVKQETERILNAFKRNLATRGQTFNEFLQADGTTEADYIKNQVTPDAEQRLKASLILSEIAELENVNISSDEVNNQLAQLRQQYNDQNSLAELSKLEVANDIASRLLAEKTIEKIASYSK